MGILKCTNAAVQECGFEGHVWDRQRPSMLYGVELEIKFRSVLSGV